MKPFVTLISILLCFACSDMSKGKQLEKISKLQASIDSLKKEWHSEDFTTLNELEQECTSKVDSIGLLYNDQKIALEQAKKIDLYKQTLSDLKELKKVHSFFPTVLTEKEKALISLRKDISKGSGRREKYDDYIAFEEKELTTIRQQFEDYKTTQKRCEQSYSESKDAIASLLKSIKE